MKIQAIFFMLVAYAYAGNLTLPNIGTLINYGLYASSEIFSTGLTVVNGDIGVFPGHVIHGFVGSSPPGLGVVVPPGMIVLDVLKNTQARADAFLLKAELLAATPATNLTGMNLGGMTLAPGVYWFKYDATLFGPHRLKLDGQNDSTSVWIFQIGGSFITGPGAYSEMINMGLECNVFWVADVVSIGADSLVVGTIVSDTTITIGIYADLIGAAITLHGAIVLTQNDISPCCEENPCACPICDMETTMTFG